MKATLCCNFRV